MLVARPAQAHSDLSSSNPKADSTITAAPDAVTLTFAERIRGDFSTIVVTGPDGAKYGEGKASAVDKTLSQPVKPLVAGKYTVAWRIVSADGHPRQGVFTFTANLPAAPTEAATTEPPPSSAAPSTADPSAANPSAAAVSETTENNGNALGWIGGGVAAILALGGATYFLRRRRT